MVVLTPTRELALQVAMACRGVRKLAGLRTACVYGGVPKEQQVTAAVVHLHVVCVSIEWLIRPVTTCHEWILGWLHAMDVLGTIRLSALP